MTRAGVTGDLLCVDVGVTHTRTARWDGHALHDVRRLRSIRPPVADARLAADERHATWLASFADLLATLKGERPVARIAIALPGLVTEQGTICPPPSVWGSANGAVTTDELGEHWGRVPIAVVNDTCAAVVRYGRDPRYRGCAYVMLLKVSGGVASKIYDVAADKVVLERRGRNGEIGLAVADRSVHRLGNDHGEFRGILDHYASSMGVTRLAARLAAQDPAYSRSCLAARFGSGGHGISAIDRVALASAIAAGVRAGDEFCRTVVAESVARLAEVLHTAILVAGPDAIVLTGWFAHAAGPWYRDTLLDALSRLFTFGWDAAELDAMVRWGEPDDLDVLLGLARLVGDRDGTAPRTNRSATQSRST
jgi:predicted NBD/HSP70 family sugar kinase